MKNKNLTVMTESAIMLALAFALSSAKLFEMPLGGSVTVASMLPIMLISFKWGNRAGLATAFLYSITQALQALAEGNIFPYCEGIDTLIICIVFDYIFPFTILGLAGVLALQNKSEEAIELMERGLPISINEKQKATMRATLCFLYLKCGKVEKANSLASELPHTRESREVIQPLIQMGLGESEINDNIRNILLGDGKSIR